MNKKMARTDPGHFFIGDPLIYFFSMNIPENLFSLIALLIGFVSVIALNCKALRFSGESFKTSC